MLAFLTGAAVYPALEMLWRGRTHPAMALAGGSALWLMARIDRRLIAAPRWVRAAACAAAATGVELCCGEVFNRKREIWDYSALPGNFRGQICPQYAAAWYALAYMLCGGEMR